MNKRNPQENTSFIRKGAKSVINVQDLAANMTTS